MEAIPISLQHSIILSRKEGLVDDKNLEELIVQAVHFVLHKQVKCECEVSIYLTDDEEMRILNHQYRDKDTATDVLSFPMDDPIESQYIPVMLGDIVISLETAFKQAQQYMNSIQHEILFLTVHGMLHLLGYDHESPLDQGLMRSLEKELLNEFKAKQKIE